MKINYKSACKEIEFMKKENLVSKDLSKKNAYHIKIKWKIVWRKQWLKMESWDSKHESRKVEEIITFGQRESR